MRRNSALLAALGLTLAQNNEGPSIEVQLSTMLLATHDFVPAPPQGQIAMEEAIKALGEIDVKKIDSLMLIGVIKNDPGQPCKDCGEVHEGGVHLFLMSAGNPEVLRAARVVGEDHFARNHEYITTTGGEQTQRH